MPDAAFWNKIADGYAAKPVDDPDAFERKIAITRSLMPEPCSVLEIGCGTGSLALRLADRAACYDGVDVSDVMLGHARSKADAAGADHLNFHCMPFQRDTVPFAPETFDVVCAFSILHLVDDRTDTLAHLYELVKPGGFLVASTVCLANSWFPYGPVLAVMKAVGKAPAVTRLTSDQLAEDVHEAGFRDIVHPDVGASRTISFLHAVKPAA